jgi:hypothetical protein
VYATIRVTVNCKPEFSSAKAKYVNIKMVKEGGTKRIETIRAIFEEVIILSKLNYECSRIKLQPENL